MTVMQAALAGLAVMLVACIAFAFYRSRIKKKVAALEPVTSERSAFARAPASGSGAAERPADTSSARVVNAKAQGPRHAPRRDYWNDMRPRRTYDTGRPLKRRAAQRGR